MVAEVVINNISRFTDNIYHYAVPSSIDVKIGSRVIVPFGRGNKTYEGYVLDLLSESDFENLKEIHKTVDDISYFGQSMSELIKFMHHRYFSPYCDIIKAVLPKGVSTKFKTFVSLTEFDNEVLKKKTSRSLVKEKIVEYLLLNNYKAELEEICQNIGRKNISATLKSLIEDKIVVTKQIEKEKITDNIVKYVTLSIEKSEAYQIIENISKRMPARARVLEVLCECDSIMLSELTEVCATSLDTVKYLVSKGYAHIYEELKETDSLVEFDEIYDKRDDLTNEQKNALDEISKTLCQNKIHLIHGVTGSGKTEIYLQLIEKVLKIGKQAIFLVPEISLTPQMIKQVSERFGNETALMHSRLTMRQRFDEWKRIKNGSAKVVVGARSAIFAPFDNLGIIIVDEEHESSYKSETSPRYNAVEIARYRSKMEGATLVLASATPSIESYYNAKEGVYNLIELKNRINNANLPEVKIVDMRDEIENGNNSVLSEYLSEEINKNLEDKKQTILFLNKLGYSSFVSCRSCGFVPKCPNCNISLTYHKDGNHLVCHYCDYKHENYDKCPECESKHIKYFGMGTQKIVDELKEKFPAARVLRMDADTTTGREGHKKILNEFGNKNADILVGTQMIAKGLDFSTVTLVGIVSADMSLYLDDFRSYEKTFSLLTQVIGRAGRGEYSGRAVIQTYYPDDDVLNLSKCQDYISFYRSEIAVRESMMYPPYCEMINITSSSDEDLYSYGELRKLRNELINNIKKSGYTNFIRIYNVTKAPMQKINGKYRYRFLIKTKYSKKLYDIIHNVVEKHYKKDISIIVDVNPVNMF